MQGQNKQKIVFVRHGHRHKPIPDDDNGISEKGREQVKDLCKAYEKGNLPQASQFWTSPKLRCQETLKPLSDLALSPLKVTKLLDEQNSGEGQGTFSKRILELLEKATSLKETVYLCSHGDLIPEALDHLTGWRWTFQRVRPSLRPTKMENGGYEFGNRRDYFIPRPRNFFFKRR